MSNAIHRAISVYAPNLVKRSFDCLDEGSDKLTELRTIYGF